VPNEENASERVLTKSLTGAKIGPPAMLADVGFGIHCWGYRSDLFCRLGNTSRAPKSPIGFVDLRQSDFLDTLFTTKS
jgi:hypothetical protein